MTTNGHDLAWLEALGITFFVYQKDDPQAPYFYENHANEAGGEDVTGAWLFIYCKAAQTDHCAPAAYLQFIVDHWACLPAVCCPCA